MSTDTTSTESSSEIYECRNIHIAIKNDLKECILTIRHQDMNSVITFDLSERAIDIKEYLTVNDE
jgi:hypothetical protein